MALLTLVVVVSFVVCLYVGCRVWAWLCVGYRWGLRHLGCEWRCGFFEIGCCCDAVSPMDCVVAVLTLVIVLSFVVCLLSGVGVAVCGVSLGVAAFRL